HRSRRPRLFLQFLEELIPQDFRRPELGVENQRSLQICDRIIELAQLRIGLPTVEEGRGVHWGSANTNAEGRHGVLIVFAFLKTQPTVVEVGPQSLWLQPQGLFQVRPGVLQVTVKQERPAQSQVLPGTAGRCWIEM